MSRAAAVHSNKTSWDIDDAPIPRLSSRTHAPESTLALRPNSRNLQPLTRLGNGATVPAMDFIPPPSPSRPDNWFLYHPSALAIDSPVPSISRSSSASSSDESPTHSSKSMPTKKASPRPTLPPSQLPSTTKASPPRKSSHETKPATTFTPNPPRKRSTTTTTTVPSVAINHSPPPTTRPKQARPKKASARGGGGRATADGDERKATTRSKKVTHHGDAFEAKATTTPPLSTTTPSAVIDLVDVPDTPLAADNGRGTKSTKTTPHVETARELRKRKYAGQREEALVLAQDAVAFGKPTTRRSSKKNVLVVAPPPPRSTRRGAAAVPGQHVALSHQEKMLRVHLALEEKQNKEALSDDDNVAVVATMTPRRHDWICM
ncbi:Aste57867_18847 [Aphanomyces stellatus]|uniref:Aste57867_18847 protein n=1 Tax=Aphanomyces stellatus TaxID=120398 RepID=A0A485LBE0_9STRA|nr:hypothetical protein As57867_018783 [Aphanomyces stellatus]VFT95581.1 Aste57867_18847 [Aphanomyces stellatus]